MSECCEKFLTWGKFTWNFSSVILLSKSSPHQFQSWRSRTDEIFVVSPFSLFVFSTLKCHERSKKKCEGKQRIFKGFYSRSNLSGISCQIYYYMFETWRQTWLFPLKKMVGKNSLKKPACMSRTTLAERSTEPNWKRLAKASNATWETFRQSFSFQTSKKSFCAVSLLCHSCYEQIGTQWWKILQKSLILADKAVRHFKAFLVTLRCKRCVQNLNHDELRGAFSPKKKS